MSDNYYQELWKQAQSDLKRAIAFDRKLRSPKAIKDVKAAKWLIGHLYINYVQIANKLDDCYDQIIHPQKREVLSRLLDLSLGRLLELKAEIVQIEHDDYVFFDNVLIELKLTHNDLELKIPKYFWRDRKKAVEHRRELMKQVFEEAERAKFYLTFVKSIPEKDRAKAWEKYLADEQQKKIEKEKLEEQHKKIMKLYAGDSNSFDKIKNKNKNKDNPEEIPDSMIAAIRLIQRHERARQGRVATSVVMTHKLWKKTKDDDLEASADLKKAATVIQRHWRRYRRRVRDAKQNKQIMELLGLAQPTYRDISKFRKNETIAKNRRILQEENQKELDEAVVAMTKKVAALYSIPMEEDIVDEVRAWFMYFYENAKIFPNFPPQKPIIPTGAVLGFPKKAGKQFLQSRFPESLVKTIKFKKGATLGIALSGIRPLQGSAWPVAGLWIEPRDFLICQKEIENNKGKKDEKKNKNQKKPETKPSTVEEQWFQMKESNFVGPLVRADKEYRVFWMDLDESKNPKQKYIPELLKEDLCMELSMKVRKAVDEMMILELELLKDALQRDKTNKKKKKKQKPKRGKKNKTKKPKVDPTGDQTLDELFIELYKNGIIRDYEEAHLSDYLGERSFAAFDLRERLQEWPPSSGDVRDLILQLCILPLGSWRIRQLVPLVKSICLIGPEFSGKEFLARIICTETGAVMFDLSPNNLVKKYPGKAGQKKLVHLIEKMSRALQPSVIFVDGAEKTFYKRIPKEEKELDPRGMAGFIKKFVKSIKAPDQVLLLGVSSRPWMAKKKKFLKIYQKIILIPGMDYASYVRLWQILLRAHHSIPHDFDVSCLAKVSQGYSVKAIKDSVKNVLTVSRISLSLIKPLTPLEFLEELLKTEAANPKMVNKNLKFYERTSLPKKRAKMLKELKEVQEQAKKKQ